MPASGSCSPVSRRLAMVASTRNRILRRSIFLLLSSQSWVSVMSEVLSRASIMPGVDE